MTYFTETLAHDFGRTELFIGEGVLANAPLVERLEPWLEGRTVFVLSTPRLRSLYGEGGRITALDALLAKARRRVELEVEDGEGAKTVEHAGRLWQDMLDAGGKRDSRLITFGGGTVGDLGGFVAGSFLRGIDYVQVPTTLLAQVDAAIGGKTGVDLPGGKNTVGLFHHPAYVLADTAVLSTLPRRERAAGLVEAIKKAALLDVELLARIERHLGVILDGDGEQLAPVIRAATAAKCRVVEDDAREGGWRKILNFGHTLAHAIEGVLGYRNLLHGEAVAYGLLFAVRLAERRTPTPELAELGERLRGLLERMEFPALPPLDPGALMEFMGRDKKATERGLTWVLPVRAGHGEFVDTVDRDLVLSELEAFLNDPWAVPRVGMGVE